MGILDQVSGLAGGLLGDKTKLIGAVTQLLSKGEFGGVSGLMQSFKDKGLGNILSSWTGDGANLPISKDQIASLFGNAGLQKIASQANLNPDDVKSKLTEVLPQVLSKLSGGK